MALHSSTLAWKIPWMEEPGRLQSMGLQGVGHDCATSLSLYTFMHWRRKWQPTPVFLPGESQGRGSLVGCHLWGHTELDTTEVSQPQPSCYVGKKHCTEDQTNSSLPAVSKKKGQMKGSGAWIPINVSIYLELDSLAPTASKIRAETIVSFLYRHSLYAQMSFPQQSPYFQSGEGSASEKKHNCYSLCEHRSTSTGYSIVTILVL